MVLLHFMFEDELQRRGKTIEFVVDDAPLKQGTFCPGTNIPVVHCSYIQSIDRSKNIAILILSWNFLPEIILCLQKRAKLLLTEVYLIVPFPTPKTLD
jgi:C-methyltransferase C-terminal domain